MNRVISGVVAAVVAAIAMSVAGFFQARGYVAVGDMRIPSTPVGWIGVILGSIAGLTAGGSIKWSSLLRKLVSDAPAARTDKDATRPEPPEVFVATVEDLFLVPPTVEHMNRCVYHLRRLLCDDAEAQALLDTICVKMGRVTAEIPPGGTV